MAAALYSDGWRMRYSCAGTSRAHASVAMLRYGRCQGVGNHAGCVTAHRVAEAVGGIMETVGKTGRVVEGRGHVMV
jgi:hypothetical protein